MLLYTEGSHVIVYRGEPCYCIQRGAMLLYTEGSHFYFFTVFRPGRQKYMTISLN